MNILKTKFAGLELENPIIIASSGKTNNAKNNYDLQYAGAGAIVLKSLFEENIIIQEEKYAGQDVHTEESDYMRIYLRSQTLNDYIDLIKESKKICSIPIIASINCSSYGEWVDFAKTIEKAGADALEVNIMGLPNAIHYKFGEYENEHIKIVTGIKNSIKIPIIVKLGSNLTNPAALIDMLYGAGASAVVLFNRMYQTDIDINKFEYSSGNTLSNASDLATPLRWTGIASAANNKIDYAISGGVKTGEDIAKAILAGASAVEVCSVIYKEGNDWIAKAINTLFQWQEDNSFNSIDEYKGRMNAKNQEGSERLMRTQFLKYFENKK